MVGVTVPFTWLWFFVIISTVKCEISHPHVIFILADDLGWNDVSFHGSDQIPTPNIDNLARRGVILNNYYVSPICTPSRSAIMTGKHPIHTGMQHDVINGPQPYGLPLREKLLPQYLKDLGYVTRIVGKWHLGFFKTEYTPLQRGFDSHFGYFSANQDYFDHTTEATDTDWGLDMRNGSNLVDQETFGKYSTELFNQEAVRLILSHNTSQPLFLYIAHLAVHVGNSYARLQAPKRYIDRFPHIKDKDRRTFAGMLAALDDSVGDIVKALHSKSMLDDAIIVFSTDNGGPDGGMDGNAANNWPLKGVKDTLWEGGVRGAGLIWSPKLSVRGRVSHQLMHVSDWLPTLYSAVGGDVRKLPADLDGINLWQTLSFNLTSPRTEVLHNIDDIFRIAALRVGDYKIVIGRRFNGKYDNWYPPPKSTPPHLMSSPIDSILDKYQYLHFDYNDARVVCGPVPTNATLGCQSQIKPCLFNIKDDPCEFHNLADTQPQVLDDLLEKLANYNKTAVPPRNQPDDVRASPRFHQYAWVPWQVEAVVHLTRTPC